MALVHVSTTSILKHTVLRPFTPLLPHERALHAISAGRAPSDLLAVARRSIVELRRATLSSIVRDRALLMIDNHNRAGPPAVLVACDPGVRAVSFSLDRAATKVARRHEARETAAREAEAVVVASAVVRHDAPRKAATPHGAADVTPLQARIIRACLRFRQRVAICERRLSGRGKDGRRRQ